jgi:hypothetical protein
MQTTIYKECILDSRYKIGNDGSVICVNFQRTGKPKTLKVRINEYGYPFVQLWIDGVSKKVVVHRLVALHFIPNPLNKPEVNHINGIKLDFSISNLEWCTRKENHYHAQVNGLLSVGHIPPNSVKIGVITKGGKLLQEFYSIVDAARNMGISTASICRYIKAKRTLKYGRRLIKTSTTL